ncbi:MAG: adenylate/guanylate cyclase domain-containing protein [Desulfobacterales bacterium]|nr:adenylate/guanylate cyclase domain-containing protein [Desulfobacterales bacterium]
MKCHNCHKENPAGSYSCIHCGARLTMADLADPIPADSAPQQNDAIPVPAKQIDGERRLVTVMFCDMAGFTAMVANLGPEASYAVMNQIYKILIHCVNNHGGTVNEMTGDGIVAFFGAPRALEDAPQKALFSALAIHREMVKFNANGSINFPVRMRIGIHYGPVIVGNLGSDLRFAFKAVGDTVNLAARMEAAADPGMTFVTREVYELTEALFRFRDLGEIPVKGRHQKVHVYRLLAKKKGVYRPRLGSERMIFSSMVGRNKEAAQLESLVARVVDGKGAIVNIIGDAGIGKSRLVAELKPRMVEHGLAVIWGRAISIGRNLSFHPVIRMLKKWAQIEEEDTDAVALKKLERAVTAISPENAEEIIPFVATLMRISLPRKYAQRIEGISGEALEQLILKNCRDLTIAVTRIRPVVMVNEDLHWADTSTIDLLAFLFRLAETERILFINVFRPGYADTGQRLKQIIKESFAASYIEMQLAPLDGRACQTVIANMLETGQSHGRVIDEITRRAGGNPFFIEEIVRTFIDQGAAKMKAGGFRLSGRVQELTIPPTINEVLMVRIDKLRADARRVIKVAAVIGRIFLYRVLVDVAEAVGDVDGQLAYLTAMQFISMRQSKNDIEYQFKHDLAQEAAYGSIMLRKRRQLHLKVAASIEKRFAHRLQDFYGMLAYHYNQGEDEEKAAEFLLKAGEEAMKSSASAEALHYYQSALDLYLKKYGVDADSDRLALFEKNIAFAYFNKGQYVDAILFFDRALQRMGVKQPHNRVVLMVQFVYSFLIYYLSLYFPYFKYRKIPTPREQEILSLYLNKAKALGVLDPVRFFIESILIAKRMSAYDLSLIDNGAALFAGTSVSISWSGNSHRLSRRILDFCRIRIDPKDTKSKLFHRMCALAYNCVAGNYPVGDYDSDLIEQNLYVGEIYPSVLYIFHHGNRSLEQGRRWQAQRMIDKLAEITEIYKNDFSKTIEYELSARMLLKYRQIEDAVRVTQKGIERAIRLDMHLFVHLFHSIMARLNLLQVDISGAQESLSRAAEYTTEAAGMPYYHSPFVMGQFVCDLHLLERALTEGAPKLIRAQRRAAARSGRKLLRTATKVAFDQTEAFRLKGRLAWLLGNQRAACKWWLRSIEIGTRLEARLELARTYDRIGRSLGEPQSQFSELQGREYRQYLEMAQVLFDEVGLPNDGTDCHHR